MALEVERNGERLTLTATPDISKFEDRFGNAYERGRLGIYAAVPAKIGRVIPDSAAQSAGLQPRRPNYQPERRGSADLP